jgi:hypothetical protein
MADLVGERYEPLSVVVRGDEAEILRARDHLGGRQVALQVRHLVSPFEMGALVTEALLLMDVTRHPHLPLVREHFLLDDSYYLVTEWIEGTSLNHALHTEGAPGLPLDRVLDCLVPVAGALEHLHTQAAPVVHRNVRPGSLIRTQDGRVALVGFGLSAGWGMPQPALDEPPTPATDVYGLAVTAHTLLTGAPPGPGTPARFSGLSDAEAEGVVRALRRGLDPDPARRPASPSALLEEIRAGASTLMLPPADPPSAERDVSTSFTVWADFEVEPESEVDTEVDLEDHGDVDLDDHGDVEATEEAEVEAALWASLWAGLDVMTGTGAEANSGGAGVGAWPALWAELELLTEGDVDADPEVEVEFETEWEADFSEFEADFQAEFEFVDTGTLVEVEPDVEPGIEPEIDALPDAGGETAAPPEAEWMRRVVRSNRLRGVLVAVLVVLVGATVLQVRSVRAERNELRRLQLASVARALAARVEGEVAAGRHERAALLARQAELFGRQSGSGNAAIDRALRAALGAPHFSRVVATARGGVWSLALSPDGTRLAAGGSTVRLIDPRVPQARSVVLSGHLGAVAGVAFSPDGKTLASGGADPTVRLWSLDSPSSPPMILEGHADQVTSLAFGFAGQRLATASRDGTVRLWDLGATPPMASVLNGHTGAVTAVAFSPDGGRLASAGADGQVRIWDVAQPAAVATLPTGTPVGALAYSPEGRYLATGGDDGLVRVWDALQPEIAPRILTGHGGPVTALAVSADGATLSSGGRDQTVRLWPLTGEPPAVLAGHTGPVTGVAFSPTGDLVVSSSADGSARRWRLGESSSAGALSDPRTDRSVLSDLVCQEVGRNLSTSEWEDAVGPGLAWRPTCAGLPRG